MEGYGRAVDAGIGRGIRNLHFWNVMGDILGVMTICVGLQIFVKLKDDVQLLPTDPVGWVLSNILCVTLPSFCFTGQWLRASLVQRIQVQNLQNFGALVDFQGISGVLQATSEWMRPGPTT